MQQATAHADLTQQLFKLASDGDAQATEKLLMHCQPDLRRYARRHCASEDVRFGMASIGWIFGIARRS